MMSFNFPPEVTQVIQVESRQLWRWKKNGETWNFHHLSNEKRAPGYLLYIGDEILPNYMGFIK